jgi:hypothetical protein
VISSAWTSVQAVLMHSTEVECGPRTKEIGMDAIFNFAAVVLVMWPILWAIKTGKANK